jgi:hypothetical protein
MTNVTLPIGLIVLAASVPGLFAIELQPNTVRVWTDYVQAADARMQARLDKGQPFLWTDESSDRKLRVQRGEVVVAPVIAHGSRGVPGGMIHDWIGAAFIPNATIDSLFRVVHDYQRYKDYYRPAVADSKVTACTRADQEFSMVWQHKVLFVNAAMEGRYRAHDIAVDPSRGFNVADTTEVREIEDYGRAGERLLPAGTGNGFIWRLHSIARYQERDGGVYLELEAIALTRDIPASLRFLVSPVVKHLSANSLTTTLRQTRDAVTALPPTVQAFAACPNRVRVSAAIERHGEN